MNYRQFTEQHDTAAGAPTRPFIIAEAGVNHEGSLDLAKRLIEEAREGGAHAIKFQTYKAEGITVRDSPAYWDTTKEATLSQFDLFKKYDSFWKEEYGLLKEHCDQVGIEFMSTPFDTEAAVFLAELMDVVKISSSDITNLPFIEFLCSFGKPILLSTGASYDYEISRAVELIEQSGNAYCLMHCILNYPTDDKNANLGMIVDLRRKYPRATIGYSDHTLPGDMSNLEIATLLGASVLEKHFTHDKSLPGNDHYHAMDRSDLKQFSNRLDVLFGKLGSFHKRPIASEVVSRRNARRSLVLRRDIQEGDTLTAEDITWKRPAHGISPQFYEEVVGKRLAHPLAADAMLQWQDLAVEHD